MSNQERSFKNYIQGDLELAIDILSGEVFASQRAVARMCQCAESNIRYFITAQNVTVLSAQIQTQTGFKTAKLLSEDYIVACLAKYNPICLGNFAKLGLRAMLHEAVGYKHQPVYPANSVNINDALDSQDLVKLIGTCLDVTYSGLNLKPELLAGLKLNAIEQFAPDLKPYLLESRQMLINSTAQPHQLLTVTDIGKALGGLSAQAVNKLLINKGFQIKNPNKQSKKDTSYLPIGQGHEFADLTLATGTGKDTTTYQQLRWYESIIELIS